MATEYSDADLARQLAGEVRERSLYVPMWHEWRYWTGQRWERDQDEAVIMRAAIRLLEGLRVRASAARLAAVVGLARRMEGMAVVPEVWDADPWVLNTPTGLVDLRSGQARPARATDYCTRMTRVGPGSEAPRWRAHLSWMAHGERDWGDYLHRFLGYTITGSTREQALLILHGRGANGKSVLLDTVLSVLGDYAAVAPPGLISSREGEVRPDAVARMQGVRLALVSESEVGHYLNEGQVKTLTGDALISARRLYGDYYDFRPTAKYVMATNHRPRVRGNDEGIWRRLRLLACTAYRPLAERDPDLTQQIIDAESPGVLTSLISAARLYDRERLPVSGAVDAETRAYRQEMDLLGAFLEECCVQREGISVPAAALYRAYQGWTADNGERPWTMSGFALALRERGFTPHRTELARLWLSLGLRSEHPEGT